MSYKYRAARVAFFVFPITNTYMPTTKSLWVICPNSDILRLFLYGEYAHSLQGIQIKKKKGNTLHPKIHPCCFLCEQELPIDLCSCTKCRDFKASKYRKRPASSSEALQSPALKWHRKPLSQGFQCLPWMRWEPSSNFRRRKEAGEPT